MSIEGYGRLINYWRILVEPGGRMLGSAILANGIVAALWVTTIPLFLSQEIHFEKGQVAVYYLVYSLAGTLLNLLAGRQTDRRTPRYKVVALAGVLSTSGYCGLCFLGSSPLVYLAGILSSTSLVLFSQLFSIARTHLLARSLPAEQTVGMTTLRTVFILGYVAGTLLASAWSGSFLSGTRSSC